MSHHQGFDKVRALKILVLLLVVCGVSGIGVLALKGSFAASSSPSGEAMPVGNLNGWKQIFTEDFTINSALGSGFPGSAYAGKWNTYGDVSDTNKVVYYTNAKTVSVNNGVLDVYVHSENGKNMCAEFSPKISGQLYGRYSVRYRADGIAHYGGVWLMWPDDQVWPAHGEIDYPEGGFVGYNMFANAHYADPNGGVDNINSNSTAMNWHTYTMDWAPGKETFYLDGRVIGTSTHEVPSTAMYYSYQCGHNNGTINGSENGHIQVDWVTEYAYSPGTTGNPSPTPPPPAPAPSPSPTPSPTPTPTPTPPPSNGTITLNDTSTGSSSNQFNFSSGWQTDASPSAQYAYQSNNHYTNVTGASYSMQFTGTQAKVYAEKSGDIGIYAISIDSGAETMVDGYSSSRLDNTLIYISPNLSQGPHTVKVRNAGTKNGASNGTYIVADRVAVSSSVTPTPSPSPTPTPTPNPGPVGGSITVNDHTTGSGTNQFNYSGSGWATNANPVVNAYQQDTHHTTAANAAYAVQFYGTEIRVYTTKGTDYGISAVSIDGGSETIVDNYSTQRYDQALVYTSPPLNAGLHTLKVRNTGNKNARSTDYYLGADKVYIDGSTNPNPTPTPVPTPNPPAPGGDTTPPSAPTSLSADATSTTQVNLKWGASTDNVGVDHYNIIRGGIVIAVVQNGSLNYADNSVLPSSNYSYSVKAVDAARNESSASNSASVTTPAPSTADTMPPSAPSGLSAAAVSGTQVNLRWNASSDNVGVAGYRVYRGGTQIASVTTTSYGDSSGLSTGSSYVYTVKAYDAAGNVSGVSNSATVTTPVPTPTPSPTPPPTPSPSPISATSPCGDTPTARTTYKHVIWLFMENHPIGSVINASAAPYMTSLARSCAYSTAYSAVSAPSEPNYLAAVSGSTSGINDDNDPSAHVLTNDNIFRQVRALGGSAKSYQENMPSNCYLSVSGDSLYKPKHNPAAYYTGGSDRSACNSDNLPMGSTGSGPLASALASESSLATFSFLTPNMCNDNHDCSVATADAWVKSWMTKILNSPAYASGDTAVMLVYDEANGSDAGSYPVSQPDPNIMIAPSVIKGKVSSTTYNHYNLLRTTEEMLGINNYLSNASSAKSMRSDYNF